MKERILILSSALLIALAFAGCGGGGKKGPPSASHPAADLHVTERRSIDLPARSLAISPDGKWLVGANEDGALCLYATDSLVEQRCVTLGTCMVDFRGFAWSPNSQHIALTELFQQYFKSDLWRLEVESGEITNLTGDIVDHCGSTESTERATMNILQAWSPDGEMLVFVRVGKNERGLYRVPADGGTPEKLLALAEMPLLPLLLAGDGETILYSTGEGLWSVGLDGQALRQVVERDPDLGPPFLMDVSAQGGKALVIYRLAGARDFFSQPNLSYVAVVDLNTGETEPLLQSTGAAPEFYGPTVASFSPDGSKVVYVYNDAEGNAQLAVRDLDGETSANLLALEHLEMFNGPGHSLTWTEDDTLFLPFEGLLLSLGVE